MKRYKMKRWLFVLCTFLLLPTVAQAFTTDGQEDVCATAAVIMCENFESRTVGGWASTMTTAKYKNLGWGSGDGSSSVVNTQAFDGTKSWQMYFPAGANNGAGYSSTNLPSTYPEIYYRSYVKFSSNFQWSVIAMKWLYVNTAEQPNNTVLIEPGNQNAGVSTPTVSFTYAPQGSTQFFQSLSPFTLTRDQWVCVEIHLKMNTANQANGVLEGWINGTQHWSYMNVNMRATGNPFNNVMISGFWNCVNNPCNASDSRDNHPDMYRWHDNIVVSTQRIGCLGAPVSAASGDTTPPATPTGLIIR